MPDIPMDFLRTPIAQSVFAPHESKWIPYCIRYLETIYSSEALKILLEEKTIGSPRISVPKYNTSDSTVMQLYHIEKYEQATKSYLKDIDIVYELGGGYGNMARMFANGKTWVMVDIPIMSMLQYWYLSHFYENGRIVTDGKIIPGKINIVSLPFIDKVEFPDVDMFISTFALNECGNKMGEYLEQWEWYGAKKFLLAHWGHHNIDLIKNAFKVKLPDIDIGGGCPASYTFI
jgi:hypothetical protein